MKTPEKLPLGRYLIEELQGPEGYYNDPAYSVEFEIKSDRVWQVVGNATNDMDEYIVTEKYCNHETLGQLTIRKLGNVLTDYQDGQFIYTQDNLAGAVYEIHRCSRHCHTRPPRYLLVQIRRFGGNCYHRHGRSGG